MYVCMYVHVNCSGVSIVGAIDISGPLALYFPIFQPVNVNNVCNT